METMTIYYILLFNICKIAFKLLKINYLILYKIYCICFEYIITIEKLWILFLMVYYYLVKYKWEVRCIKPLKKLKTKIQQTKIICLNSQILLLCN